MKPNFEKMINGKLTEIKPATIDELFEAIRCDWSECYSDNLQASFVIHLN